MRILGDKVIESFLLSLKRDELLQQQHVLLSSLQAYNTDNSLIPQRIVCATDRATHLFMPGLGDTVGIKTLTGSKEGFKGVTMIIDPNNGEALGILNASTLTPFRTALATSLGLVKFFPQLSEGDHQITVIGSGLQALWHVKLAFLLYPKLFDKVVIVNRSLAKLEILKNQLLTHLKQDVSIEIVSITDKDAIAKAADLSDVIFGCTPSTEPVVYLESLKTQKRRFIGLIGSYKPHMQEVDSALVHMALESGGKIVVDSIDHVSHEAGEIILNHISKDQLVSIVDLDKTDIASSDLMLYKLVGLSIMDTSIGGEILKLCELKNIGHLLTDF